MDCVRNNSLRIWEAEKYQYVDSEGVYDLEYMTRLIIAASQLHDVADHKVSDYPHHMLSLLSENLLWIIIFLYLLLNTKYGKTEDQLSSVRQELSKHFTATDVTLIKLIIENMSYSKEAKHRQMHGSAPTWNELGQGMSI